MTDEELQEIVRAAKLNNIEGMLGEAIVILARRLKIAESELEQFKDEYGIR